MTTPLSKETLRRHIVKFNKAAFTTTELRQLVTLASLKTMWDMVEAGEIEFLGVSKPGGGRVGIWREVCLRFEDKHIRPLAPPTDLLGWREAYPFMFADPQLPGKRSAFHKGEL